MAFINSFANQCTPVQSFNISAIPCIILARSRVNFYSKFFSCKILTVLNFSFPSTQFCKNNSYYFNFSALPARTVSEEFSSSGDSKTEEEGGREERNEKRSNKEKDGKDKDRERDEGGKII